MLIYNCSLLNTCSEGSNVANFTTEPTRSRYVPDPKCNMRNEETADEELGQIPSKKNRDFNEEFKDQELKELEQEHQLLGKWLEEKTKELAIITSLLDQKAQILDQKKRKLQYVVAKINCRAA